MPRLTWLSWMLAGGIVLAAADNGPTVAVDGGRISGRLTADGGAAFRGVPFARAPVGDLRWREPQPVAAWSGVRDAGEPGPPCAQNSSGWNEKESIASREDCLYLDVRVPAWPPARPKPVMVWIHGGANTGGAGGADPLYEGTRLVSRGVILVVVEYRLGVFGFLAHPGLSQESPHHVSGNYALLDQVAALRWVHANIAKFGGDPGRVTLFGQSAGAADLTSLMASPLAKGLFHRAIAESGGAGTPPPLGLAESSGVRLAATLKAPPSDPVAYLRSLSAADLLAATRSTGGNANVDGWVLPAAPSDAFAAGAQHHIPYIVGTNGIEMTGQRSPDELRLAITARFKDLAPKVLALYGLADAASPGRTDPLYGSPNDQWTTDSGLRCPGIQLALRHGAAAPTWSYEFDRAIPPKPTVVHSSELPYVFGNLLPTGSQAGQYTDVDRKLSDAVQIYWTNFAKTGDPNGPGVPRWPAFDAASRGYIEFGVNGEVAARQNQRRAVCDAFIERSPR